MNKKVIIEALTVRIEEMKQNHSQGCMFFNKRLEEAAAEIRALQSELAKAKAENNELLLEAENHFKEYIEDTTANLSQEQHQYFRPLFNIKSSLEGLRSAEEASELSERMQQVLAYVYEDAFVDFFYHNKGLLFDILAKVQPGCVIEPKISK